jgi:hypothetical protein
MLSSPIQRFAGFSYVTAISNPTPNPDADAAPTPTPEPIVFPKGRIVVHAPQGVLNAEVFVNLLQGLQLNVQRGFKYPADANPLAGLVYVQIGSGSLWAER